MIQRIQSLYLLLAILAVAAVFLFDAVWPGGHTDVPSWMPGAMFLVSFVTVAISIWAILLYNDRRRQLRVVLFAQIATIVLIAVFLYGLWDAGELRGLLAGPGGAWKLVAIALPFVAYVFLLLARKGIERDIELVRSIDRLR